MALPQIGPISLGDIQAEFCDSDTARMSEYYRGGGSVPDNGINNAIPTPPIPPATKTIRISKFRGATAAQDPQFVGATQFIVDATNNDGVAGSGPAAGFSITSTGRVVESITGFTSFTSITLPDTWHPGSPDTVCSQYQIFVSLTSGSLTSGSTGGTWQTLTYPWTVRTPAPVKISDGSPGVSVTATGQIAIRSTEYPSTFVTQTFNYTLTSTKD